MKAKAIRNLETLQTIAQGIRDRRLSLGISTVAAAHAAGVSRVTWHRIEKAEPSVTMGAYVGALEALGLTLELKQVENPVNKALSAVVPQDRQVVADLPASIPIQNYSQLRQLAWHVRDDFELTPEEAFGLYDRYRRHLNIDQMEPHELSLLRSLENATLKAPHAV
jgi:transcriptional regulator with XRE-family HTH domain